MQNANEWINWIEEAIAKDYFRLYEHEYFSNVQKIGTGGFGKVYRASWRNSEQYFALKSFFNIDDVTAKEIVHELKLQRDIQFHNNIIKFYGVAKFDPENVNVPSKNYLLVMEYADSGPLKDYLKENFNILTWNDKYNLAYQLACAVSCLHNEGIVHRDLHSGNVLVHQNIIKLSDFGLSKRIESSSNTQSKLFGIIPYVDPKRFSGRRKNKNQTQIYSLNEKSDVYSIGVLFWEISSGKPPFYAEGEKYDLDLAIEILQGLREDPTPDTPEDYIKIYTECWNGEPDKRPTINQVVERLKEIITKMNVLTKNYQTELSPQSTSTDDQNFNPANISTSSNTNNSLHGEMSQIIQNFNSANIDTSSNTDNSLHGEMSQFIQDFDKMNTKEVLFTTLSNENISIIVNDIINYIFKILNEGKESTRIKNPKKIFDYFNKNNINSREIYDWLLINQNNLNSVFLFGYFNYLGIETSEDNKKAFDLFINASEQGHALAKFYVGLCYQLGHGTGKDEKLAFKYFEKIADMGYAIGLLKIGYLYNFGIVVSTNKQKAVEFYQQAANLGNITAQYNLANKYSNGEGVDKDYEKAIELYQKAADSGYSDAQYNLALMYEYGEGTEKNINQAIYWYEKSAKQGDQDAQNKLEKLRK
ncbi:hypothetical protein RclHR1_06590001 [Rhizophagus clarus]|uniref:Protein kinase domain-containing protein n=1 Tax=Rhizophagus clarus TaxID=94130 RepID=A0A2Z6RUV3_9GLOM|nr:hypothetical protein RclHR1_06590001 [Rhizophagus clarus]